MPLVSIADLNGNQEEVARYTEQARKLSTMYDEWIETPQKDKYRAPGIHASELFPCARQGVYSCLDTPRKPKVSKFWAQRFKVGHALHSMYQNDFHKMAAKTYAVDWVSEFASAEGIYLRFEDEVPCSPEHQELAAHYGIYSSCDGIFTFYDTEVETNNNAKPVLRVGLEIKTESPDQYDKLKGPKEDHIRQAHLYMACLDLPLMWFFYTNKGNQNNVKSEHPYLIPFNYKVWAEVEERIKEVRALADKKELPPRVETIKCEFCAWNYTCQPDSMRMYQTQAPIPLKKTNLRRPGG